MSESLSELGHSLRSYCNEVIAKWQNRTQLSSGRVSSNKDFVKSNQSIVTQIDHVTINYYYYYYMISMDRISWPFSTNMVPAKICLAMQFPEVDVLCYFKLLSLCALSNDLKAQHSRKTFILTLIHEIAFVNS